MSNQFPRISRLPPYVFNIINDLKMEARRRNEDIIDFGMGNPDQKTPQHIINKLIESAALDNTHRYSLSMGVGGLRRAICNWYKKRYDVTLNPETEAVVTMGSKEGLAHLAMAVVGPGDTVLVPNPSYPIHPYGFVIAGADVRYIPMMPDRDFFEELDSAIENTQPKPRFLLVNFPGNPTTECVNLDFFTELIARAKKYQFYVIQDLAYADLVFDGYKAPSILQVPGAIDVAVEFFSMSKSYNMPGWRVGFMVGNEILVNALKSLKSYLDYGLYLPIQLAAITALESDQHCVKEVCDMYQRRRDILCDGLNALSWKVEKPQATMFVWAPIPKQFLAMGSLKFSKKLLLEANIAVSPGIGFGKYGDGHVRFALIENRQRIRQALRNIHTIFHPTKG